MNQPLASASGVLLVDKPAGITSADVTNKLKKKFRFAKIGHGGTLDPFATGLLVVLLGEGTKAARFLLEGEKTIPAKLRTPAPCRPCPSTIGRARLFPLKAS
jgi:tRNA pseudouridine(55) synthase